MKRAPLLVLAGTVAGFVGILSFRARPPCLVASGTQAGGGTSGSMPAAAPEGFTSRASPAPRSAVRTALGAEEQFDYSVLDVQVAVRRTRITDVSVPTLQVAEATSQQICEQAIRVLRAEVLSAQSASIDAVSDTTFTSDAYDESLQAAH